MAGRIRSYLCRIFSSDSETKAFGICVVRRFVETEIETTMIVYGYDTGMIVKDRSTGVYAKRAR